MINNNRITVIATPTNKKGAKTRYITLSWYDDKGKRKQQQLTTGIKIQSFKTKKEQKAADKAFANKAEELRIKKEKELNAEAATARLFTTYLDEWLAIHKNRIKLSTYQGYERIVQIHIKPYFNNINLELTDIQPRHIQQYYQFLLNEKGLSANTVLRHNAIISAALNWAVRQRLIPYNPLEGVEKPKAQPFEKQVLTTEQSINVLNSLEGEEIKTAVYLSIFLTLRRGEVLGLTWDKIDFENNIIHICQTRTYIANEIFSNTPKSEAGDRFLEMPPSLKVVLIEEYNRQQANIALLGNGYVEEEHDYVCRKNNGSRLKVDYPSHRFKAICRKLGLGEKVSFHSLRHTAATLIANSGTVSMTTMQSVLGHKTLAMTSRYIHPDMKAKSEAVGVLEKLIGSSNC